MKLTALALVAFVGVLTGVLSGADAQMRLEPLQGWPQLDEVFTVTVILEAQKPINVFQGDIEFDPEYLAVESIDYNNSLADLWAVEPWYSNGEGTITFAGGVTQPGGFVGQDTIISIQFRTQKVGTAEVGFSKVAILKHDGLGSDASITLPVDAVFAVAEENKDVVVSRVGTTQSSVYVLSTAQPTDLDGDGKQGAGDLSIFLLDLISQNPRSDFNQDGVVSIADFSILIE